MAIALVLNEENIITPIVEGVTLRIVNEKDFTYEDFRNPALDLKEGRRGAALKLAIEKKANIFVTPPETFCKLSYQKARENQVQFLTIAAGLSYDEFDQLLKNRQFQVTEELRAEDVVPG